MTNQDLLLPIFVQVALTFVLMFSMAYSRTMALKRRDVRMADIALGQQNWPVKTTQISNAYANQFELPVLFYVVSILAMITGQITYAFVVLAWIFVLFRIGHALVHTGSNYVRNRFYVFLGSVVSLMAMWVLLAISTLAPTG